MTRAIAGRSIGLIGCSSLGARHSSGAHAVLTREERGATGVARSQQRRVPASCGHRGFAAAAEQRVLGGLADLFQDLPAACAFVAVGGQRLDGDARPVGQGEGAAWTLVLALALEQLAVA